MEQNESPGKLGRRELLTGFGAATAGAAFLNEAVV